MAEDEPAGGAPDRVLTIPNALSVLRLLGVPLFLYLLLGPQADGWAIVVLAVSGATDYLDGKLARMLDQGSRLGALLDPAADRLYVLATLVAFVVRDIVPWWVAAVLVGRDLVLAATFPLLRRRGMTALPVHYLGKAATFCLLYAFPLLLAAQAEGTFAAICRPLAYAFALWGGAMYLWAGVLYLVQVRLVVARVPPVGPAP
ncbi:CDP-alcohol phosphatidyltransferase family protein [Rhodococcus aerolatus]